MSGAIFDYHEFQRLIERISGQLPELLGRHKTTADLVAKVVNLLNVAETPFSLAIIGQMRVGKSSLLNALVGADLAVTGVTETTATINWFKYGEGDQCRRFRVVWKDRPAEDFPTSEIARWVGDSQRAESTKYIEFFADVPFLQHANVVDTPGTRSTIQAHETATQEFLARRREQETQREGDSADALLYVLMPVARQSDQDLLEEFESGTRLPGSFPYNSLAILHKWETLEVDDPLAEGRRKAEKMSVQLADLVARVVPVSAPLAIAATHFGESFWTQVLDLACNSTPSALEELQLSERFFTESKGTPCALDGAARRQLRTQFQLPWRSFTMVLKLALTERPGGAQKLRTIVQEASGIQALRDELEQRFFSRYKLLKAFSVLAKAVEPCRIASVRLRNHKVRLSNLLDEARQSSGCLAEQIARGLSELVPVQRYIDATQQLVEKDLSEAADVLRGLGEAQLAFQDAYQDMDADLKMLELVERHLDELGQAIAPRLRCLFGSRGLDVGQRIRPWQSNPEGLIAMDDVQAAIGDVRRRWTSANGDLRQIFGHAVRRLEQIADWLEEEPIPQGGASA